MLFARDHRNERPINFHKRLLLTGTALAALLPLPPAVHADEIIDNGAVVTIPGTHPSPWDAGGVLTVGDTSTGTLVIVNGGVIRSVDGVIGATFGSSGMVTVRDNGSQWITTRLYLGTGGTGTLSIENGGSVTSTGVALGSHVDTSSGSMTVTGAGSRLRSNALLSVGDSGTGVLTIENGGTVNVINNNSYIGFVAGSSGTVTVRGPGSQWSTEGNLSVGNHGTGTLTIEDGGSVHSGTSLIGDNTGSSGTVTVSGAGSRWTTDNILYVGGNGTGTLTIANGGAVSSDVTTLGFNVGGQGTLTLNGTNISRGILTTGQVIKDRGDGTLTFNGGILRATRDESSFVSGFAPGNVVINGGGAFLDSNGHTIGIANVLSGSGSLTKTGIGTLTLSGSNTYTGGTTINDGTIEIRNAAALGMGDIFLAGGHLRSNIAGTATLSNPIIIRAGDPVRTISAAMGQTLNINFGFVGNSATLRFGTASDTGTVSVVGPLRNGYGIYWIDVVGGTLRAGSRALSTLLSGGAQALTIHENATVDLTTYDSTFFDLRGRGTLTGNGATFTISEGIFDGTISGNTTLKKVTPVTLTLNGRNTLTGPTQVLNGLLLVNGSLASSPVSVSVDAHGKGTLGGTGIVGSLSVLSGGTVAPGNSIGTLNVNGNVSFAPGSVYALEIDKARRSDRIAATGAATLSGGTVQILPDQGTGYVENRPYTILAAQRGVSGQFAGTSGGPFAFVTPTLGYSNDTVTLTLVRKTDPTDPTDPTNPDEPTPTAFHSVAQTINQYRTADAVEALGAGDTLYRTVLGASVGAARQAFDALSGEAHASAMSVAYEDGRRVREAILTRLRQPAGSNLPTLEQGSYNAAYAADLPGAGPQTIAVPGLSLDPRRLALWGEGFGSWGKADSNGNAASLDTSTGGFILGADAALDPTWRLGVAGGFTRTTFDIDGRLSSGTNESIFSALYGSSTWGALSLRLGAAYAWYDVDIQRRVQFPGFTDSTGASYDGWSAQAFAELSYRFDLAGFQLEPFIGASVLRLHMDTFQEEGGAAALTGLGQDQDLATTTLGLRAQTRLSADVPLTIRGMLGWRHAFDVEPETLLAFAGSASAFAVAGVPVGRNALAVEAGLDWQASDALSLGVAYSGQIDERAQDHALKGNLVWRFGTH
ncbi:autotransporter domain-containing protein [Microvirga sp. VF16]|uniref:autotransporter domain-containing protein n=1 Tax=Microvirga sp. VF16 TaxID=2807101 RepID=UPI00193DDBA4|nr:autotransporter domain-containing protein [Microvirga sp. VF16]QRM29625.1 autotransporter domain-containing protein [Microvirga sp. VF16]